jgi:DNA mismatch repair protein MutS
VNERYITEELKEYETKILGAEEEIHKIESELFEQLVAWIATYIKPVQLNANLVAQLDCLCSLLSWLSRINTFVLNWMNHSNWILRMEDTRYRKKSGGMPYIANDVFLDRETQQLIMITGPICPGNYFTSNGFNSAVSSNGSFVPADSVRMGIVDKIFTRVASDNISMGESTLWSK